MISNGGKRDMWASPSIEIENSFGRELSVALRAVPWWAWLGLAASLVVRLALAWQPPEVSFRLTVPDDGYYYFTIARNIARGMGTTFDGVTPTNGFHPLWMALITPLWMLAGDAPELPVQLALTLGALLDVVTALGVWFLSLTLTGNRPISAIALMIYAWNPYQMAASVNGLETSLSAALFVLSLVLYWRLRARPRITWRQWLGLTAAWALLVLARTDYLIIILPCAIDLVWRQRRRLLSAWAVPLAGLFFLPWLWWNLATFGTYSQVSGQAYPYYLREIWQAADPTLSQWMARELHLAYGLAANLARLSGFGKALPLLLVSIVALVVWRWRQVGNTIKGQDQLPALVWPTLGAFGLLAFHGLVRWMYIPWYFVPLTILLILWFSLILSVLHARNPVVALAISLAVLAFQVLHGLSVLRTGGMWPDQGRVSANLTPYLEDCRQYGVLGITDSGYLGYFLPCRVVNLDGVVNNQVFESIQAGRFRNYLDEAGIRKVYLNQIIKDVVALREGQVPVLAPFATNGDSP